MFDVVPGRDEVANPESILTLRLRLVAFAENKKRRAWPFLYLREWPKGQARRGYGFRACACRRIPE